MTVLYVPPQDEAISILRGIDPAQVDQAPEGTVYLLHLDRPLIIGGYAWRHYIGWASQGRLERRMRDHRLRASGVKFLRTASAMGCTWHLARVWPGDTKRERQIKIQGGASRFCPSCGIIPAAERQLFRDRNGRYITPPRRTS